MSRGYGGDHQSRGRVKHRGPPDGGGGNDLSTYYREKFGSRSPEEYKNLRLSHIDPNVDSNELREALEHEFRRCGGMEIKILNQSTDEERLAYVNFERPDIAKRARRRALARLQDDVESSILLLHEEALQVLGRYLKIDPAGVIRDQEGRYVEKTNSNPQEGGGNRRRSPPPFHHQQPPPFQQHQHHHQQQPYNQDRRYQQRPPYPPPQPPPRNGPSPPPPTLSPSRPRPTPYDPNVMTEFKLNECVNQIATRSLFVGNLVLGIKEEQLRAVFDRYGRIIDVHIKHHALDSSDSVYAFINFENLDMSQEAKFFEDQQLLAGGKRCHIRYAKPMKSKRLFIGGLGTWTSIEGLAKELDRFGNVERIDYIPGGDHAYALFDTQHAAAEACESLKGFPLGGRDRCIRIDFSNIPKSADGQPLILPRPVEGTAEGETVGSRSKPPADVDDRERGDCDRDDRRRGRDYDDGDNNDREDESSSRRRSRSRKHSRKRTSRSSVGSRSSNNSSRSRSPPPSPRRHSPQRSSSPPQRRRPSSLSPPPSKRASVAEDDGDVVEERRSSNASGRGPRTPPDSPPPPPNPAQEDAEEVLSTAPATDSSPRLQPAADNEESAGNKEETTAEGSGDAEGMNVDDKGKNGEDAVLTAGENNDECDVMDAGNDDISEPGGKPEVTEARNLAELEDNCTPCWTGNLMLKKAAYPIHFYKLKGDDSFIRSKIKMGDEPIGLNITQRRPLATSNPVEYKKYLTMDNTAFMLATPDAVTQGSSGKSLRELIAYLNEKKAGGVVTIKPASTDSSSTNGGGPPAPSLLYMFPKSELTHELLSELAPNSQVLDQAPEETLFAILVQK